MTTTKFCKTCGKIMWDVQPTKRYCDSCIRKRNIKSAQASYQRRRDAGVLKKCEALKTGMYSCSDCRKKYWLTEVTDND